MEIAFEDLYYRRVELVLSNENQNVKDVATELGFRFEGLWRKLRIVNGKRTDFVYFSVINKEWPLLKAYLRHKRKQLQTPKL